MLRIIILLMFCCFITESHSQIKYSLDEAVQIALNNNKELKISESKKISSDARINEIQSQFFPQLKLTANYTRLSDVPPFEISMPLSPVPIKISDAIVNNYTFKIAFQQTLFSGFRTSSLKKAAEFQSDVSEVEVIKAKNDAAYQVGFAFWNLYRAGLFKAIADQNVIRFENHLRDAKNFMYAGLLTKNDILKLEVQLSNSKLNQLEALSNLEKMRIVFNKSIGVSLDSYSELEPSEIKIDVLEYPENEFFKEAISNRSEISAAELQLKAGYEYLDASKSGYYPNIFLLGGYNFSRPNVRYQPTEDKLYGSWDIGITLSWDIWNWGYTTAQKIQAEQNINQIQYTLELIKENILLEVKQNLLEQQISKEKLEVCKKTIQQAEENLRITSDKYSLQFATTTDLIDAENYLYQAKIDYNTSLIDYQLSKIKLEKSLGRKLY